MNSLISLPIPAAYILSLQMKQSPLFPADLGLKQYDLSGFHSRDVQFSSKRTIMIHRPSQSIIQPLLITL